jgi:hypothetical protein
MKTRILFIASILSVSISFGQTMRDSRVTRLYLVTDVKAISSASSNNSEGPSSTGVGKLGVAFKSQNFYGNVLFNVANKNKELKTPDSTETKVFANNLLIPDNSGQGLSNFHISMGMKSFSSYEEDWSDIELLSWKRIGAYGFWQVNNTMWTKDSVSSPVYISSLGIYATYNILSLELLGEEKDKVYLSWFGGFESRILGGDYSLNKNESKRNYFLETNQLKYKSFPTVGFKLEIGKFYGKISETHFGDGNLDGFSGWQATITVGLNVDLNIAAK